MLQRVVPLIVPRIYSEFVKYSVDLLDKMNVTFKLAKYIAHKPLISILGGNG